MKYILLMYRVDCFGVNDTDINPKLFYNGQRLDDQSLSEYKWPVAASYQTPNRRGIVVENQLGLYTCTTYENTANITHALQNRGKWYIGYFK